MSLKNLKYKAAVEIPPLPIDTYMGVCVAVVAGDSPCGI